MDPTEVCDEAGRGGSYKQALMSSKRQNKMKICDQRTSWEDAGGIDDGI